MAPARTRTTTKAGRKHVLPVRDDVDGHLLARVEELLGVPHQPSRRCFLGLPELVGDRRR